MGRAEVLPKWAREGREPPRYRRESAPAPAPVPLSPAARAFELVAVGGMPVWEAAFALDVSPAEVCEMVRKQAASDAAFLRRWLAAEERD